MTLPNQQDYSPHEIVRESDMVHDSSSTWKIEEATVDNLLSTHGIAEDIATASNFLSSDPVWQIVHSAFDYPVNHSTELHLPSPLNQFHDMSFGPKQILIEEATQILKYAIHPATLLPHYTAAIHHIFDDLSQTTPVPSTTWHKKPPPTKKRSNLSSDAKRVLRSWFDAHFHHPYPTDEEKERLRTDGGITLDQVNNWFINTRVREWKPKLHQILAESDKGDRARLEEMLVKVKAPYQQTTLL